MSKIISVEEFVNRTDNYPLIDVRSPGEFVTGHIQNAINMPIFSNEERAIVGTHYKQNGKYKAVHSGLEFVGPKMADFASQAHKLAKEDVLYVHCWRGGMRSKSMAWLFETIGIETRIIDGGYKAYRQFHRKYLTELKLIVLGGSTGSGKTDILRELKANQHQIIDLEGLAHHKGSAFGAIGEEEQPSNEQFENNLFAELEKLDLSKPIWVEDESKSIGKNWITDELFDNMRNTILIYIDVPKEIRAERLVIDYGGFDKALLEGSLDKISKRIGGQNYKECISALNEGDLLKVAMLSLTYYDKTYGFGVSKRESDKVHSVETITGDPKQNAEIVLQVFLKTGVYS